MPNQSANDLGQGLSPSAFWQLAHAQSGKNLARQIDDDLEVDDLADLYLSILEAVNPPQVVNAVTDIVTWAEFISVIGQSVGVSGDFEIVDPQTAMALGGLSIYVPMNMPVSSELAKRELA